MELFCLNTEAKATHVGAGFRKTENSIHNYSIKVNRKQEVYFCELHLHPYILLSVDVKLLLFICEADMST